MRTRGRTRSRCRLIRERVPVRARSSRARARKRCPSRGTSATATPVPAHASSAMACSVSRAWQIRQAWPVASSSSVVAERSRTTAHSSATSPGSLVPSPSTQAHQPALASAIARYQSGISEGGQLAPGDVVPQRPYGPGPACRVEGASLTVHCHISTPLWIRSSPPTSRPPLHPKAGTIAPPFHDPFPEPVQQTGQAGPRGRDRSRMGLRMPAGVVLAATVRHAGHVLISTCRDVVRASARMVRGRPGELAG